MSYKAAQRAACLPWPEAGKAGPTRHAVYNVIAGHADSETNRCFLSMPTIAAEAWGIDERTARRAVRVLEGHGAIRIVTLGSGRGNATVYEIVPTWSPPAGKGDTSAPLSRSKNGAAKGGTSALKGGHQRPERGAPTPPQQDHEQYQEQSDAAAAPPGASGGRVEPAKSKITSDAARARELTLTGSRPRPTAGRAPHEHEARQGPSAPPVRNDEAAALLVELGRLHDLEFSAEVVSHVLAEAVPLAALQAERNPEVFGTGALPSILWIVVERFDEGASAACVVRELAEQYAWLEVGGPGLFRPGINDERDDDDDEAMSNGEQKQPWRGIDSAWMEQHLPSALISEMRSMLGANVGSATEWGWLSASTPEGLVETMLIEAVATASIVSPGAHSPDFPYRLAAACFADALAGKEPRDLPALQALSDAW